MSKPPKGGDKVNNLAIYRKAAGLTQQQLADKLGVKRTALTNWETGVNITPTTYLLRLSEILGCTIEDLLRPAT
jgi:transcriptional regulator with XRE-family HTH domain